MTVQQFIDLLKTFDPHLKVFIYCDDCSIEYETDTTVIRQENREVVISI